MLASAIRRYRVAMGRLEQDNSGQLSAMDAEHRAALDSMRQELTTTKAALSKVRQAPVVMEAWCQVPPASVQEQLRPCVIALQTVLCSKEALHVPDPEYCQYR